jgi:hypothetical protein
MSTPRWCYYWPTWTSLLLVLYVVIAGVHGQDDFGDDSDGGGEIVDMEAMMGGDRKEARYSCLFIFSFLTTKKPNVY